ncbi:MAG: double-strand break repair helicase AddA [Hyphomonadaceae bacterium]
MTTPPTAPWKEWEDALAGQAAAAEPQANAWVAANAGSGKTKVLIDRVARLLLSGAEPDSILCVTYTKAAASEMQDRLFARLGDWCVTDDNTLRAELTKLEGERDFSDAYLGRARELFARALETPGGLRIETIHAFCGRLLRRFPLEAGVAPGFQELDDQDSDEIWDQAFLALGARVVRGNPELVAAARAVAEAGGAGFDILRRLESHRGEIQSLLEARGGIDAAINRLRSVLGAPEASEAELLDAAMNRDLPRSQLTALAAAIPIAKPTDATLVEKLQTALSDMDAAVRFEAYAGIAFTDAGEVRKKNPYTAEAAKVAPQLADLFQTAATPEGSEVTRVAEVARLLAARRVFDRSAALIRVASPLLGEFEKRKRARAGLDFDDLIDSVSRLFERSHAAEWVLWKLDGGIAHVLLDEAQDTSPEQWRILRRLTAEIFAGAGAVHRSQRTLFIVGDQKQSIYSFQGADPEHFLRQARELHAAAEEAGAPFNTPSLAMSFRSVRQVLTYVDDVFDPQHFSGGAPFSVQVPVEADYAPHTAHRRHEPGCVELWPLQPPADVEEPDPWDAPVDSVSETDAPVQLARRIAGFIAREIANGAGVWEKGKQRPARPGDFLILVKRRTGGIFDAILQQLKARDIPVAGADRILLLDSAPVQDVLNLVRFALCPADDLTLAEILKGPFGAHAEGGDFPWLDDNDLFDLAIDRQGRLWDQLRASKSERFAPLRAFLEDVLARRHQPPFEFITHALELGRGLPRPGWELILSRFGGPAREPVSALVDRAAGFDADQPPSLELFLAAIEASGGEVKRELSGPQDEVRVMTVHGAKGLQAPIVILPDTTSAPKLDTSGLFFTEDGLPVWAGPKSGDTPATAALRQDINARALREHRRLLYVALTRAQDRLVVCGAWYGRSKEGRDKDSWYQLCEAGMQRLIADGQAAGLSESLDGEDATVLRLGDAPPALGLAEAQQALAATLPAWLRTLAPAETGRRILSPSRLTASSEPPVLSPFGAGRAEKLRRGTLIHMLFEVLPGLPAKSRWRAAENFLKKQLDLMPDQRTEMLDAAFGVLDDPQFADVFGPGGRPEAPVIGELPNGAIINGRVDRLVVAPDRILAVDYKTDRPAPASVAGVGEAYIAQMAAYRAVLSQRWPDRPVRCLLVWTDGPKPMEIPPEMLDKAINRLR